MRRHRRSPIRAAIVRGNNVYRRLAAIVPPCRLPCWRCLARSMAAGVRNCGGEPKRADWEQRACVRFAHRHIFVISSARSTSPIRRCAMTSVSRLDNLSRRREVSYWSMSFNLTSDRCLQSGIISTIFLILLGIFCCWPLQSPGYLLTSAVTRWSVLELFFFGNTYLYFIWQLQSGGHLGICRHFYHLAPSQSS